MTTPAGDKPMIEGTTAHIDPKIRLVPAIPQGTVIDHLPPDTTLLVAQLISEPNDEVLIGVNFKSTHHGRKGVVKITGRELNSNDLSRLAVVAPQASIAIIRNYQIFHKAPVPVPEHIINIARCPNPNCVTNHEPCDTHFTVTDENPLRVRCRYCERQLSASELILPT